MFAWANPPRRSIHPRAERGKADSLEEDSSSGGECARGEIGVERDAAKARQLAMLTNQQQTSLVVDNYPQREEQGKARDAIGAALGVSGKTAECAAETERAAQKLDKAGARAPPSLSAQGLQEPGQASRVEWRPLALGHGRRGRTAAPKRRRWLPRDNGPLGLLGPLLAPLGRPGHLLGLARSVGLPDRCTPRCAGVLAILQDALTEPPWLSRCLLVFWHLSLALPSPRSCVRAMSGATRAR